MCSLKAAQIHGRHIRATKITCAAFVCTRFHFYFTAKRIDFPQVINQSCAGVPLGAPSSQCNTRIKANSGTVIAREKLIG